MLPTERPYSYFWAQVYSMQPHGPFGDCELKFTGCQEEFEHTLDIRYQILHWTKSQALATDTAMLSRGERAEEASGSDRNRQLATVQRPRRSTSRRPPRGPERKKRHQDMQSAEAQLAERLRERGRNMGPEMMHAAMEAASAISGILTGAGHDSQEIAAGAQAVLQDLLQQWTAAEDHLAEQLEQEEEEEHDPAGPRGTHKVHMHQPAKHHTSCPETCQVPILKWNQWRKHRAQTRSDAHPTI